MARLTRGSIGTIPETIKIENTQRHRIGMRVEDVFHDIPYCRLRELGAARRGKHQSGQRFSHQCPRGFEG
jgi:hypothetical protein